MHAQTPMTDGQKEGTAEEHKKKILFLITKSTWGGAQRYVYDVACSLDSEYDVLVAAGGDGPLIQKLSASSIRTVTVPALLRDIHLAREYTVLKELFVLLRKERPDIVHLNSSKAGGLGACAIRLHNFFSKKRAVGIFTAHGWAFKEERTVLQKIAIGFFSYLTVLLTHATITVSEDDYTRALWMPFVKHKLHQIHTGISTASYKDRNDARRELFAHNPKRPVQRIWVGIIAELHTNKGLPFALQAMETIKETRGDVALVIIGEGEERAHLENLIQVKNLGDTAYLTGAVPDAAQYLHAFDIFMLPSVKEGLPYTILEAGDASLPTIATAVGGIPEIIRDMQSGILVRPKNAQELRGALQLLIDDEEKRAEFGKALNERVRTSFTLEHSLRATKRLYTDTQRFRGGRQEDKKTLFFFV